MKMSSEVLDDFFGKVKAVTAVIENGFTAPDDDWVPTINALSPEGQIEVALVDPSFLVSEESKKALAIVMAQMAVKIKAVSMVFVTSSWMAQVPREIADKGVEKVNFEELKPYRKEALVLSEMRGDVGTRLHYSYIHRNPILPPKLGMWEVFSPDSEHKVGGQLVDPVESLIMASYALVTTDSNGKEED